MVAQLLLSKPCSIGLFPTVSYFIYSLQHQGLPANETLSAVVAYMVEDFYKEGAVMEFPKGGSTAIVGGLADAVTKRGGTVRTRSPVARVVVEGGRAVGVELQGSGEVSFKKKAINILTDDTHHRVFVADALCAHLSIRSSAPPPMV